MKTIASLFRMDARLMIRFIPFGMDLVLSIYYLAAPLVLISLDANPIELGLIGTLTSSVHMVTAGLSGRLSDRVGRRPLIVLGPAIFLLSGLLMAGANRIAAILALAAFNGLGLALFWPPFQAWIADRHTGAGLARDIGSFNMSWTASHLVGPILSGSLYTLHPRLPFLVGAAFALLGFLVIFSSVGDQPAQRGPEAEPLQAEDSTWKRHFLYAVWCGNFVSWFLLGNVRYQFPKLARELAIDPPGIGLLIGSLGLAQFVGFSLLRQTDRWHFRRSYFVGAQLFAAAGMLLILSSSAPLLFAVAFFAIGLCASLTYNSSLYYSVHLVTKKGKGAGIHETIVGSGALCGPILGGIAAQYAGLRTPYLLCLAVLGLAIGAELVLTRRSNNYGV
jgi:MFS family permease